MPSVLILEDEENLRLSIARRIGSIADTVHQAGTLAEARGFLARTAVDVLITDVNLPDGDGIDLIEQLAASGAGADSIVITAYGTVEHAVDAMRRGASDYLQKPVRLDELALVVQRVLDRRADRARLVLYERAESIAGAGRRIIGEDRTWTEAIETAARFAEAHAHLRQSDVGALPTLLITGETGSGKGVVARFMHDRAVGAAGAVAAPFVQINCAALPADLVESELFGHEKGSFTGAKDARPGYFELADGGTIFLDEIAEMSPELQAKLLLVMENGMYRRVGGTTERRVRARVVAATNKDLTRRVAEGSFRQDLFYRLSSFLIALPALRERRGDALRLAEATLERLQRERGGTSVRFSEAALERIASHAWPGNVRELVNAVQRAIILCRDGVIEPADLALQTADVPRTGAAAGPLSFDFSSGPHTIEEVERALLEQALAHCDGNVTKAARLVGMPRGSFRYRMEKAGLAVTGDPTS